MIRGFKYPYTVTGEKSMHWKSTLALSLVAIFSASAYAGTDNIKPPVKGESPYYGSAATHPALTTGPKVAPIMLPAPKDNTLHYPSVEREPNEGNMQEQGPGPFIHFSGDPYTPNQASSPIGMTANTLVTSLEGIGQTSLTPPDNAAAVGGNYIVETVNSTVRITNKIGNILYENTIQSFLNRPGAFIFDPKVIFDPWRNRWIMLWHEQSSSTSYLHVVVSADSNPYTNGWWYYAFDARTGSGATLAWADNYDLGYGSTAIYACGNQFTFAGSSFTTATFRTWDPAQIYAALAAGMITDSGLTNADGSTTFAPRAVHMMFSAGGEEWYVNSRNGGGSKLTIHKVADPLGAHSRTRTDVAVSAYTLAPAPTQPGGSMGSVTGDCRLSPAFYTVDPGSGTLRIFTSLNCASVAQPTNAACRCYILDASASTTIMDTILWYSGGSAMYCAPAVNYFGSCNWVHTYVTPSTFAGCVYINYEPSTGFSFSSSYVRSGTGNYFGGRWGDYFQGDMDWGDYYNGSPSQKMWFYGEYAKPSVWATAMGATLSVGKALGNMVVSPTSTMSFSGYVGNVSGGPFNTNVANTGDVSSWWQIVSIPSVLSASISSNEQWGNSNTNTSITYNAGIQSLPYGHYTGNVTFQEQFQGGTTNRPYDIQVYGAAYPESYIVKLGNNTAGNLGSFSSVDSNFFRMCKGLVPNLIVAPINVEVYSTAPGFTAAGVYLFVYSKMANGGNYKLKLEMWNYGTGNWDATDFSDTVIGLSLSLFSVSSTGSASRYIGAGQQVKARYTVRATGLVPVPVWCNDTDYVQWAFVQN